MNDTVFSEVLPAKELRPYVHSYWYGNFNMSAEAEFAQSVLPNGCMELIVHLTEDHCFLSKENERWTRTPEFILLGLYNQPYTVRFKNIVKVFGMRFYPDGIRNIFGVHPVEFLSTYEDGTLALGDQLRDFCSRLRATEDTDIQISYANAFIARQLQANYLSFDFTHLTMKLIRSVDGIVDYGKLLHQIPISSRQLQRVFKGTYGITVMDYIRLLRMNSIYRYMMSKNVNLSQLSYELNFTDQSHFIKEFKNFVGVAPTKFLRTRGQFIVNPKL
jgi:AraC-like DNA-binding protein